MSEQTIPHQLILTDRKQLMLSGIGDVDTFDDTTVILRTAIGDLTIKGAGLHVQRLNIETGDVAIDGTVDRLEYSIAPDTKRTRLARWFR